MYFIAIQHALVNIENILLLQVNTLTNPGYHEGDTQNADSHITVIAELKYNNLKNAQP